MTWVDASYTIHDNMRSHTGGMMSFGIGALHTKSTKQKLDTKSLTEAELVGVSEYLPYHIWLINFLEDQGYKVKEKLLFQDTKALLGWKGMEGTRVLATQDMWISGFSSYMTGSSPERSMLYIAPRRKW